MSLEPFSKFIELKYLIGCLQSLEQGLYNYLYNMIGQFSSRPIMLFYIEIHLLEIFWNLAKRILLITLFMGKPCLGFHENPS